MVESLLGALLVGVILGIAIGYSSNLMNRNKSVEEAYYLGYERGKRFGYEEVILEKLHQKQKE
ncbi:unnamed protein product [Fructobacillus fructosus]|uniref:hypothetical protein n=1 Tax=Fructobacillus fructosus TaxID=1631 RepID=UPI002D9ED9D2|nr:unnamed protein product [Fructobacillus fructosus]